MAQNNECFSTTEANLTYVARNEKREVADHIFMARKRILPWRKRKFHCCSSHKSSKKKPVEPVSENFQNPCTVLEKRSQKKTTERNYKEQPKIAIDGMENNPYNTIELFIGK